LTHCSTQQQQQQQQQQRERELLLQQQQRERDLQQQREREQQQQREREQQQREREQLRAVEAAAAVRVRLSVATLCRRCIVDGLWCLWAILCTVYCVFVLRSLHHRHASCQAPVVQPPPAKAAQVRGVVVEVEVQRQSGCCVCVSVCASARVYVVCVIMLIRYRQRVPPTEMLSPRERRKRDRELKVNTASHTQMLYWFPLLNPFISPLPNRYLSKASYYNCCSHIER
jgi:hypothetical protein